MENVKIVELIALSFICFENTKQNEWRCKIITYFVFEKCIIKKYNTEKWKMCVMLPLTTHVKQEKWVMTIPTWEFKYHFCNIGEW